MSTSGSVFLGEKRTEKIHNLIESRGCILMLMCEMESGSSDMSFDGVMAAVVTLCFSVKSY